MGNFIDFIFGSICCSMLPPIYDTYADIKDQVKKLKNFLYLLDFPIFSEYNCSEFYSFPNTFDKRCPVIHDYLAKWIERLLCAEPYRFPVSGLGTGLASRRWGLGFVTEQHRVSVFRFQSCLAPG